MAIPNNSPADEAFISSFDADFPYEDPAAATKLILKGWQISLNAAFFALHEICRPPRGVSVSRERQQHLLDEWARHSDHPLKDLCSPCAQALIAGPLLSFQEGVRLMRGIGQYEGQYNALAVVYFASDCSTPEGEGQLEQTRQAIYRKWNSSGAV
ncbi:hypothetical protein IC614_01905 [Allosphingosinicella flava]|uniref:Uncharacterized protein n=1 Tax=Allosphingosinicella flava TaxID=2771430 RepID=A0A7T2LMB8_9SPHN|nr:hypothetical protein [Sphingosinicella flava]QPQ55389.1 hypothetical protein IC614_01905 [Sphingosinicella flava]